SDALDNAGAGIVILVNAMAEAHEFNFAGFDALDEVGDFADGTNFMEHADDFFVGAAMKRTVESGDGGGSGGIRIDVRAANAADDVSGTVLFVISVKDEENVERAFERRIRTITRFGGAEKHVQKIAGIAEIVVRIDKRHAERVAISEGGDRGHFTDQAKRLFLARFRVQDVLRVVVERGKPGDGGDHHAHGMGVVMKAVEKCLDAFVNESV